MIALTDEQQEVLIQAAREAQQWAYAPYSHYAVGAAVLTASGRVYDGVNVENAAYPDGICAERVAIFKAVSEGERQFVAIAVATPSGGSPCGSCRQVLAEFGLDTLVLIVGQDGRLLSKTDVRSLLPNAFAPHHLKPRGGEASSVDR